MGGGQSDTLLAFENLPELLADSWKTSSLSTIKSECRKARPKAGGESGEGREGRCAYFRGA